MNVALRVLAPLLALPVGCAPLIDFDGLTGRDAGVDAAQEGGVDTSPEAGIDAAGDAVVDAADPCVAVDAADNGFYCGTSRENGFAGGAPDTLYGCVDGRAASVNACVVDCIVAPPTYPDTCDDCTSKPDGTWCGSEFAGYLKTLANVKFTCASGKNNGTPIACAGATPTCRPGDGGASCAP